MKNIEEKKKEFLNKFAVNATETFFGNKEQLAKDGWEVGGTMEWIWKSSTDADRVWEYIQALLEEAQKEARELTENDYEIGFTDGWQEACNKYGLDYDVRLMLIASRKKIKEFKESIKPVERISEEKPSTDI